MPQLERVIHTSYPDSVIRNLIGPSQNFDVMADQNGYNSAYSGGNYEYVLIRNYTGYWRFDTE